MPLRADLHKLLAWLQPDRPPKARIYRLLWSGRQLFPLLIGSLRNLCTAGSSCLLPAGVVCLADDIGIFFFFVG
ncbi:hypothetical protein BDV33DRAFT_18086 [Aspergillus novoparasiticus]|uniref:Uncharacterized protein n=1 Tax=Aspergillus novoparasiticus TaxID=986946 RepID=A0A5N6F2Q2_9EURO|nr:hypothetical protein BDV33DRAFT_18086 [Aspergillus novoparasiticus]